MQDEAAEGDRGMSAFDAWLFRGDRNPRTRSMLVAVVRLEAAPDEERWLHALERASRAIPRLRQRVVEAPVPLVLPAWVVDPDFDLACHVRRVRLPAPGTSAQLLDLAAREAMRRLDESRPLWEATLVDGVDGDGAAVLLKLGHAVADGVGAMQLFATLFDTAADAPEAPLPPAPIPEDLAPEDLLADTLRRAPHAAVELGRDAGRLVLDAARAAIADPAGAYGQARRLTRALDAAAGALRERPAPSALLRGRSLARRCLAFDVPLAGLKAAGRAAGGSVNDAYLAALAGALREYHLALDAVPAPLPLALPLNLRRGDEQAAGNHFGAALIAAPLDVADAAERIARVRELVQAARANPATAAPAWSAPLLARLPEALRDRLAEQAPAPDVQASNVPGSPVPLWLAGRRVLAKHAFGPVPGAAMMVTLQSYAGTCHVGITYDPAAVRDAPAFGAALVAGFDAVLAVGEGGRIAPPVLGRARRAKAAA